MDFLELLEGLNGDAEQTKRELEEQRVAAEEKARELEKEKEKEKLDQEKQELKLKQKQEKKVKVYDDEDEDDDEDKDSDDDDDSGSGDSGSEVDGDKWLINDKTVKKKEERATKKSQPVEVSDPRLEKVSLDDLIWCPCRAWFRQPHSYWPGIIRPNEAVAGVPGLPWPIPEDRVVVQFICIPVTKKSKAINKFQIMAREDLLAFSDDVTFSRQSASSSNSKKPKQQQLNFNVKEGAPRESKKDFWSVESMDNLSVMVQNSKKYSHSASTELLKKVKTRMTEFLELAIKKDSADNEEEDDEQREARAKQREEQLEDERRQEELQKALREREMIVDDNKEYVIKPGTWISYHNDIGHGGQSYSQVVRVDKSDRRPLKLTTEYPLERSNLVRVMDTLPNGQCDKSKGSSSRAIKDFKLVDGVSLTIKTATAMAAEDAQLHGKLTSNGRIVGGASSSSSSSSSSSKLGADVINLGSDDEEDNAVREDQDKKMQTEDDNDVDDNDDDIMLVDPRKSPGRTPPKPAQKQRGATSSSKKRLTSSAEEVEQPNQERSEEATAAVALEEPLSDALSSPATSPKKAKTTFSSSPSPTSKRRKAEATAQSTEDSNFASQS